MKYTYNYNVRMVYYVTIEADTEAQARAKIGGFDDDVNPEIIFESDPEFIDLVGVEA